MSISGLLVATNVLKVDALCSYASDYAAVTLSRKAVPEEIRKAIFMNGVGCDYLVAVTVRAPVFGRHQFFGTSEHYGKAHGSLLSGWMNYNYTACCWFPTSSNILILPSQFWQIRFESCWLYCSKCRILVLLRYRILWQLWDAFGKLPVYVAYDSVTAT